MGYTNRHQGGRSPLRTALTAASALVMTMTVTTACGSSGTIGPVAGAAHTGTSASGAPGGAPGRTATAPPTTPTAAPSTPQGPPPRSDADTVKALTPSVDKIDHTWESKLLPGGDATTSTTLDLCGAAYPSEALRTARRQMQYGASDDDLPLSTEVVTYRAGGAAQAMAELQSAIDHCPGGLVQEKDLHGGMAEYHVSKMINTSSKWLPGTIAIVVTIDHRDDGTTFTYDEIAQTRGNVVSIVYCRQDFDAQTMNAANAAAELLGAAPLQNV